MKDIQTVLGLPELKIVAPSDTQWLAHERCIKAVKSSYSGIISTLDAIYVESGDAESYGLSVLLKKSTTAITIYFLSHALSTLAILCRSLQTKDIKSEIPALVSSTLACLTDLSTSHTNTLWHEQLQNAFQSLKDAGVQSISPEDFCWIFKKESSSLTYQK